MTGQAQTDPQQGTGSILGGLGASLGATALVGKLGGGVGKMGAAGAATYDIANGDFSSIPSDMYHGMVDSKALSMAGKGRMSSLVAKGKDALGFAKEVGSDVTDAAAKSRKSKFYYSSSIG